MFRPDGSAGDSGRRRADSSQNREDQRPPEGQRQLEEQLRSLQLVGARRPADAQQQQRQAEQLNELLKDKNLRHISSKGVQQLAEQHGLQLDVRQQPQRLLVDARQPRRAEQPQPPRLPVDARQQPPRLADLPRQQQLRSLQIGGEGRQVDTQQQQRQTEQLQQIAKENDSWYTSSTELQRQAEQLRQAEQPPRPPVDARQQPQQPQAELLRQAELQSRPLVDARQQPQRLLVDARQQPQQLPVDARQQPQQPQAEPLQRQQAEQRQRQRADARQQPQQLPVDVRQQPQRLLVDARQPRGAEQPQPQPAEQPQPRPHVHFGSTRARTYNEDGIRRSLESEVVDISGSPAVGNESRNLKPEASSRRQ